MTKTNTGGVIDNQSIFLIGTYTQVVAGSPWSALTGFLGAQFSSVISNFLQEIILAGLIIGGMITANSMSIKLAGATVSAAKGSSKAVGAWAAKRSARGGLNFAARTVQSRPRIGAGGIPMERPKTRFNTFRDSVASKIQNVAQSRGLDTKGLMATAMQGAGKGFKGFYQEDHKKKKGDHGNDDDHNPSGGGGGGSAGRGGGGGNQNHGSGRSTGGGNRGNNHASADDVIEASEKIGQQTSTGGDRTTSTSAPAPQQVDVKTQVSVEMDRAGFGGGTTPTQVATQINTGSPDISRPNTIAPVAPSSAAQPKIVQVQQTQRQSPIPTPISSQPATPPVPPARPQIQSSVKLNGLGLIQGGKPVEDKDKTNDTTETSKAA